MIFRIAGDICSWFDAFLAFFSCPQATKKGACHSFFPLFNGQIQK